MLFSRGIFSYPSLAVAALLAGCAGTHAGGGVLPASGAIHERASARHASTPWTVVYAFDYKRLGNIPDGIVFGPKGTIFGSTLAGGDWKSGQFYAGLVFELVPSGSGYTEKILHRFENEGLGKKPGPIALDGSGNIWGAASKGIYELTPGANGWIGKLVYPCLDANEPGTGVTIDGGTVYAACRNAIVALQQNGSSTSARVIYHFKSQGDGTMPNGNLLVQGGGAVIYGTTSQGGDAQTPAGTVYRLTRCSDGTYVKNILYSFDFHGAAGGFPLGGVTQDSRGALYGTTGFSGSGAGTGTIFKLAPGGRDSYQLAVLDNSSNIDESDGTPVVDDAGNLYVTSYAGMSGGEVVKLVPRSDGSYSETILAAFPSGGNGPDPTAPVGTLRMDGTGRLWGVSESGGEAPGSACGCGTIFTLNT